jgi:hypothetical protein
LLFEFQKRRQISISTHNEALTVATMRDCNPVSFSSVRVASATVLSAFKASGAEMGESSVWECLSVWD